MLFMKALEAGRFVLKWGYENFKGRKGGGGQKRGPHIAIRGRTQGKKEGRNAEKKRDRNGSI